MTLSFQDNAGTTVAVFSGRLDSITSPEAQNALVEQVTTSQGNLVLDLSNLDYLSSAGLRVLLTAVKKITNLERRAAIAVQHAHIREILQISGFHSLVPAFNSVAEATAAVAV